MRTTVDIEQEAHINGGRTARITVSQGANRGALNMQGREQTLTLTRHEAEGLVEALNEKLRQLRELTYAGWQA